jgi:hypothetical protein
MKLIAILGSIAFAACVSSGSVCEDDHCVCPATEAGQHTCSPGGNDCHVQCAPNETCDVICAPGEQCHVEASQSSHSTVDCNGGVDCHVTCPIGGCTVTHCSGADCVVACLGGEATLVGTTASCP